MTSDVARLRKRSDALRAGVAGLRADLKPARTRFRPPCLFDFVQAVRIPDKASETGHLVNFTLWPAQHDALKTIARHSHVFWAKSRQIGATTCALAYGLHGVSYVGNREVLVIRTSQVESNDAILRCVSMHESLPPELQAPAIVAVNASRVVFANGSRIVALPATEKVARGHAAWLLIMDEYAFYEWQEEQLHAAAPSASRVLIVTTGNGPTDYAYDLWRAAEEGRGEYHALFKPWTADPRRDEAWYQRVVLSSITPRLSKREYPAVPEECWTAPTGVFFERWDAELNTADLAPVPEWETVRAVDWGIRTAACCWLQLHPSTRQVFVVGELACHDLPTSEFCEEILRHEARWHLDAPPQVTYADPAGQGRQSQSASTEFEVALRFGLNPVAADNNQHAGCLRLLNLVADPELPLVVARSCRGLCEAFATIRPDRHREDIYDDSARGDACHLLDAVRYGVGSVADRHIGIGQFYMGGERRERQTGF